MSFALFLPIMGRERRKKKPALIAFLNGQKIIQVTVNLYSV